jgi:hypothetical protein
MTTVKRVSLVNSVIDHNKVNKLLIKPEEEQPIRDTFVNNYNIVELHMKICNIIAPNGTRAINLMNEIEKLQMQLSIAKDIIDIKILNNKITALKKKLDDIQSSKILNEYTQKVQPYINYYISNPQSYKVVSIINNKSTDTDVERLKVITSFINIARCYVDIDIVRVIEKNMSCESCGFDLSQLENECSAVVCCPNCGLQCNLVNHYTSGNDPDKKSKSNYEDKNNMLRAIKRYQGKQNKDIPKSVFDKLDEYFSSLSLPTREEVMKMPKNERGMKPNTSVSMMLNALSNTGNSMYYEDVNLICHLYWGWDLPNIEHLEDAIMEDYDKSQRVFDEIKGDRKSSLNTQYRLFRHLQKLGYPCTKNDFKIVITKDILEFYEETWKTICEKLNWKYIPIM